MTAQQIQAKKVCYRGIQYRSTLEAKTAQSLDNLGIPYQYEPDGYQLTNGVWYKPDFYLPGAKQFIECKGVMSTEDSAKICGLVQDTGIPVVVISYDNIMLVIRWEDGDIVTYSGDSMMLGWCRECKQAYFYSEEGSYECTGCTYYVGDSTMTTALQISSGTELFNIGQEKAADKPLYKEIAERFNN